MHIDNAGTLDYAVTIDVRVIDIEALYNAALARALADGVEDQEQADEMLKPEGEIDAGACLVMLLDPGTMADVGCEIHNSSAEEVF